MSTLSPDTSQGQALYEGSQSFYPHDDAADPKSGGVYDHNNLMYSAHEAEAMADWARYINTILQAGVASVPVRNETGGALSAGTLVYVSGYSSGESKSLVSKADPASASKAPQYVLSTDLSNNANGTAYSSASVSSIDTSGASAVGDLVYLSSTAGAWAYADPGGAYNAYIVGVVTAKDAVSGSILYFPGNKVTKRLLLGGVPGFTGIQDPTLLAVSYSTANRQITIVNSGTEIAVDGTTSTPAGETTAAHADTTAGYFFYYESGATTLTVSTTAWDILSHVPVAYVYYNTDMAADGSIHIEERHSTAWTANHHYSEHFFHGTKYISGLAASSYTVQPGSPANSDNQVAFAAGKIADEDILSDISAVAAAGPYTVLFRNGTDASNRWDWDTTPVVPYLSGGSYMQWNELTGGSWQKTESSNGKYINMWAIAVPRGDAGDEVVFVMGQAEHSSADDADDEEFSSGITWGANAPSKEFAPLYRFTFATGASYSTTGKVRIHAVEDLRGIAGTGTAAGDPAGTGDVLGPASSTDNSLPRFDGTTGKIIQGGQTVEDDSGNVAIAGYLDIPEQAAPATPSSGLARVYIKTDGKVYSKDDAGTEYDLTAGASSGDSWSDPVDADIVPDADGTRDLGATATRFAETYTDALDVTNNATVGGSVTAASVVSDTVAESTPAAGVTVDGLTIKDAGLAIGSDADGDLYYRASGALARLAKGTAGQALTMNTGATAPEWSDAAGSTDILDVWTFG